MLKGPHIAYTLDIAESVSILMQALPLGIPMDSLGRKSMQGGSIHHKSRHKRNVKELNLRKAVWGPNSDQNAAIRLNRVYRLTC